MASMHGRRAPLYEAAKQNPALAHYSSYDAFGGDVWSWAITVYVMASSKIPFEEAHIRDPTFVAFLHTTQPWAVAAHPVWSTLAGLGYAAARTVRWRWPRSFSPALVELLSSCMRVDPNQRPTMEQVLQHPWMQEKSTSLSTGALAPKVSLPLLPLAGVPISTTCTATSTIQSSGPLSGHSTPSGRPITLASTTGTVSLPFALRSTHASFHSQRTFTAAVDQATARCREEANPFALPLATGRSEDSSLSLTEQRCDAPRDHCSPHNNDVCGQASAQNTADHSDEANLTPYVGEIGFFPPTCAEPPVHLPSTSLNSVNTSLLPGASLHSSLAAMSPLALASPSTAPPGGEDGHPLMGVLSPRRSRAIEAAGKRQPARVQPRDPPAQGAGAAAGGVSL